MSNLPILWQNTCLGLTDGAQVIYLRGAARDERKALRMACQWQDIMEPMLVRAVAKAAEIVTSSREIQSVTTPAALAAEVLEFIRERHFRKFFPDGRSA